MKKMKGLFKKKKKKVISNKYKSKRVKFTFKIKVRIKESGTKKGQNGNILKMHQNFFFINIHRWNHVSLDNAIKIYLLCDSC